MLGEKKIDKATTKGQIFKKKKKKKFNTNSGTIQEQQLH